MKATTLTFVIAVLIAAVVFCILMADKCSIVEKVGKIIPAIS